MREAGREWELLGGSLERDLAHAVICDALGALAALLRLSGPGVPLAVALGQIVEQGLPMDAALRGWMLGTRTALVNSDDAAGVRVTAAEAADLLERALCADSHPEELKLWRVHRTDFAELEAKLLAALDWRDQAAEADVVEAVYGYGGRPKGVRYGRLRGALRRLQGRVNRKLRMLELPQYVGRPPGGRHLYLEMDFSPR
jgi:hypothetical protein